MNRTSLSLAACVVVALTGCGEGSGGADSSVASVSGTALYRERIAMRPGAELVVELRDVSKMDVPAEIIGSARLDAAREGPPYTFEIGYDSAAIQPGHTYVLHARIEQNGELRFVTDMAYPAFAETPHELLLKSVAAEPAPDDGGLTGTRWELVALEGSPSGAGAEGRAPYLRLRAHDRRVNGFSGCNSYGGGYSLKLEEELLSFSQLFSSQKACEEGMTLETRFLNALIDVAGFSLGEGKLTLKSAAGRELARFEAREDAPAGDASAAEAS